MLERDSSIPGPQGFGRQFQNNLIEGYHNRVRFSFAYTDEGGGLHYYDQKLPQNRTGIKLTFAREIPPGTRMGVPYSIKGITYVNTVVDGVDATSRSGMGDGLPIKPIPVTEA